jgi:hypothetical protein
MKQQVSPKIFFAVIAIVCLAMGAILYRQATDPLYHHEPDEEAARRQFSKPASASSPSAPEKSPKVSKPGEAARNKSASKPETKSEPGRGKDSPSHPGP